MNKVTLFDIPINAISKQETLTLIDNAICNKKQIHHTVINASKVVLMQSDASLYKSVVEADLINADGMSIVWTSKLFGKAIPERVTGIDLMEDLVKLTYEKGYKIYFFGAQQDVLETIVDKYSKKYSPDIIAGFHNGYYKIQEEECIAKEIADSGAQILFVAINSPIKEIFLHKYKEILKDVYLIMGVGGSFDVISGKVKRAPVWMQNSGLEWLFRLLQEPGRLLKRYTINNLKFIGLVIKEVFSEKQKILRVKNA